MGVSRLGAILASLAVLAGCSHGGGGSRTVPAVGTNGHGYASAGVRHSRSNGTTLSVVQSASNDNSATGMGSTLGVTLSAPPRAGNLLLVALSWSYDTGGATNVTPPAGWMLVQRLDVPNALGMAVYSRIATGTEGMALNWHVGDSDEFRAIAMSAKEIQGADTANPVDVVRPYSLQGGYNITIPSATASRLGELGVAWFAQYNEAPAVQPTGFTAGAGWTMTDQRFGASRFVAMQAETQTAPGTSTTAAVTASDAWNGGKNSTQAGLLVLVEPSVAVPASGPGIVQSAHDSAQNTQTVALSLPSAPTPGNLLLAAIMWSDSGPDTYTPPAGWTLVDRVSNGNTVGILIYEKLVQSGDGGGPYTFTATSLYHSYVTVIDEVQGVDTRRPFDVVGGQVQPGGYSSLAQAQSPPSISGGFELAFFNQYNYQAMPSAFAPSNGFAQRDVVFSADGENVGEQIVGTTAVSRANVTPTAVESWQNGHNSSMASEMLVLRPANVVWSVGDPYGLPATSDGQGADRPVFSGAQATCVPDQGGAAQCTGGAGSVSFHVQRPNTTTIPAAEYRNMMVVEKWDPSRQYAFNYELVPNGVYDVRFQTVNHMKDDAQDVQSILWQDHSGNGDVLTSLGVINPDGRGNQFFFNSGASTGLPGDPYTWHGAMTQGGVDTWEIQFRNAQDASGWADLYRNGVLQIHLTGRVVSSTSYDLISYGIYYYDWEIARSTILSTDITFNYFELSTIPGPVPPSP